MPYSSSNLNFLPESDDEDDDDDDDDDEEDDDEAPTLDRAEPW